MSEVPSVCWETKNFSSPFDSSACGRTLQTVGLDFIREINPPSSGQHKWILIATNYFTKWVEVILTINANDLVVIKFMEENILSHFGHPIKIITDNDQVFKSAKFIGSRQKFNIIIRHSTTCYPQGNGLVESSNKNVVRVLKKSITEN